MTAAAARKQPSSNPSLTGVFEQLLADIVKGTYAAGTRLPAERDLAVQLGASRPTLREALRRLGEWRLVAPKRGSGVVVRPAREWSMDVLPAYLRLGKPMGLGLLVSDILGVRRGLFVEVLRQVAPRVTGYHALGAARHLVQEAWTHRDSIPEFVQADFEAFRAVIEAADFLPALWFLNDLASVYLEIARTLTGVATPPDDYVASYEFVFTALEKGRATQACDAMAAYLERHDRRLLSALGIL